MFSRFTFLKRRREAFDDVASTARRPLRKGAIDLTQIDTAGTGPAGGITHEDLEVFVAHAPGAVQSRGSRARAAITDVELVCLRRRIAEKMAVAHAHIPHITYVEEIDVTALEDLRATLVVTSGRNSRD